jgi:hypothetical protein
MATQDPRTIVRTSTRLWSDEVGRAQAEEPLRPYDPAYDFTSGRQFVEKSPFYARLEPPAE